MPNWGDNGLTFKKKSTRPIFYRALCCKSANRIARRLDSPPPTSVIHQCSRLRKLRPTEGQCSRKHGGDCSPVSAPCTKANPFCVSIAFTAAKLSFKEIGSKETATISRKSYLAPLKTLKRRTLDAKSLGAGWAGGGSAWRIGTYDIFHAPFTFLAGPRRTAKAVRLGLLTSISSPKRIAHKNAKSSRRAK